MRPLIILLAVVTTGCGAFKKTSVTEELAQVSSLNIDEVITETATDNITVKADPFAAEFDMSDFDNDTTVSEQTEGGRITITTKKGKIRVKANPDAKEVPVNINRRTERQTKAKTETSEQRKTEKTDREASPAGKNIAWSIWGLVFLIALFLIGYIIFKVRR